MHTHAVHHTLHAHTRCTPHSHLTRTRCCTPHSHLTRTQSCCYTHSHFPHAHKHTHSLCNSQLRPHKHTHTHLHTMASDVTRNCCVGSITEELIYTREINDVLASFCEGAQFGTRGSRYVFRVVQRERGSSVQLLQLLLWLPMLLLMLYNWCYNCGYCWCYNWCYNCGY